MSTDATTSRPRPRPESRLGQILTVAVIVAVLIVWIVSFKHNAELAARRRGLPSGLVLTTLSDRELEWERRVISEVLESRGNQSDPDPVSTAKIATDIAAIEAEQARRAAGLFRAR